VSVPQPSTPLDAVLVTLGRLEVKLDDALTAKRDHEERLRIVEARPTPPSDHEDRIRALEARSTVSPGALWATVSGGAGLALAAGPVIARLFPS
jgi:hypothetical protein